MAACCRRLSRVPFRSTHPTAPARRAPALGRSSSPMRAVAGVPVENEHGRSAGRCRAIPAAKGDPVGGHDAHVLRAGQDRGDRRRLLREREVEEGSLKRGEQAWHQRDTGREDDRAGREPPDIHVTRQVAPTTRASGARPVPASRGRAARGRGARTSRTPRPRPSRSRTRAAPCRATLPPPTRLPLPHK